MRLFRSVRQRTSHVMKDPDPDYTATPVNKTFQEMHSPGSKKEIIVFLSPRWQKASSGILIRVGQSSGKPSLLFGSISFEHRLGFLL